MCMVGNVLCFSIYYTSLKLLNVLVLFLFCIKNEPFIFPIEKQRLKKYEITVLELVICMLWCL